jgi:hypothetical protein
MSKGRETMRAMGFPNSKKGAESQRAAGFPNLQKGWNLQRAAGFPNMGKGRETQRTMGFPNLKKAVENERAAGFPHVRKISEAQRASGWADLEKYHAEQKALGYADLRKKRHSRLLHDIEAANKRKLAEDPTFIPEPLPDLELMPHTPYSKRFGDISCPEPGCEVKLLNERSLATHVLRMHNRYSTDTPYKCKDPSCNKYFPTTKKAREHFYNAHQRQRPPCPICDRIFWSRSTLKRHLLGVHGIQSSSTSEIP